MENPKKKYLVTYADETVTTSQAVALLGIESAKMLEDTSADRVPESDTALHFSNLGITAVELTTDEARILSNKNEVLAVEEDTLMFPLGFLSEDLTPPATAQDAPLWNMSLVKAPQAWARNINGNGIKLAILDTGVATHPDLAITGGVCFIPGQSSYNDTYGHGTHCAGIATGRGVNNVFGVAPKATLYAVKVLDGANGGQTSWIIAGMNWCISNGIQVASMSLGGPSGPSVAWATAIARCQSQGVAVITAAGNSYQTSFPWVCAPANSFTAGGSVERPTAVAAIDSNSNIASFSSRGGQTANWNQVGVSAPGVSVYSTYLNNGYTNMSGTSMACPHVAGLAALILQRYPGLAPMMVKAKIAATAANLGTGPYPNTAFGYGLIDCDAATR